MRGRAQTIHGQKRSAHRTYPMQPIAQLVQLCPPSRRGPATAQICTRAGPESPGFATSRASCIASRAGTEYQYRHPSSCNEQHTRAGQYIGVDLGTKAPETLTWNTDGWNTGEDPCRRDITMDLGMLKSITREAVRKHVQLAG